MSRPQRSRTIDRGPPGGGPPLSGSATEPLTVGEIGPNRSMLPDGSLLCRNVPIARTGWMHYAPGEVPIPAPTQDGAAPIIYIHRGPEDLFSEETMRSFIGVAITNEHPPVPVTPQNFAHLGGGFVLRTFRGEGADADCLMADLIVKDQWLIRDIQSGKREVSCGYEASYTQTGDGQGKQSQIIGNHLALVEKGRCGPRCAIGDEDTLSSTDLNEDNMPQAQNPGGATKRARIPLVEARARVADALADLEAAEQGDADQGVHVHVHMPGSTEQATSTPPEKQAEGTQEPPKAATMDAAVEARFQAIEAAQNEIGANVKELLAAIKSGASTQTPPPAAGSQGEDLEAVTEATATMDSAALATSYQTFLSQAEILAPGFKLPTFDAASQRKATVDRMCMGRRAVLSAVVASQGGEALLQAANGGQPFDVIGSDCKAVATVFKAAAAAKAADNTRTATGDARTLPTPQPQQPAGSQKKSFADINKANREFWASQGPRA